MQTPQAPAAPQAQSAPDAPVVPGTPRSITFTGPDGKTATILLPTAGPVVAGTEVAPAPVQTDGTARGIILGAGIVLVVLGVIALYKRFTQRGSKAVQMPLPTESSERLERLERGMDAIAIEIERISEGQRFVTKMLSETRAPAISAAADRPRSNG